MEEKFKQVLYKHPKLTYFGWGVPDELKLFREGKKDEIEAKRFNSWDLLCNYSKTIR